MRHGDAGAGSAGPSDFSEMFAFENVPLFQKISAASSLKLNTWYIFYP